MMHRHDEPNDDGAHNGAAAGAEPDADGDEEAQLLPREELEFEDSAPPPIKPNKKKPGFLNILRGPDPPQIQSIHPFFPSIQEAPINVFNRLVPRKSLQLTLLTLTLLLWAILFISLLTRQLPIQDESGQDIVNLDCVDTLWRRKNYCGINGVGCRPFSNHSFAFRCPANCAGVQVLNPHAVGPLDINYRPLVIGTGVYRGDSFICSSAIHAGRIEDHKGGCGRVNLVGEHDNFASTKHRGIESIPFDSYFPLSFSFSSDLILGCSSDPRQMLLFISVFFTAALSLFSSSPAIYFPIFTLVFAQVSFASDPPSASYRNTTVLPDHVSKFARRLLPALFVAVVIYWTTVKRTLLGMTAQGEKTIFWLGGFWFGALSNYTFDWIPISRLTAHDLEQQPGAKVALAVVIIILVLIIIGQVYYFWLEGRLHRYLALYGSFILGILLLLAIPGVNLRIHHYILALLLLPGTSLQTRPSLIYQGILLGLFVNGIARWDFDSVLQTTAALRNDGKFNSLTPSIIAPNITFAAEGLMAKFSWNTPPEEMDGISVLVNDVERDRAFWQDGPIGELGWEKPIGMQLNEYFRFAYVKGGRTFDYTSAGVLTSNGSWTMEQDEE